MKLLRDKRNKKDGPSQFVPTNMAVNFVQHNRCKLIKDFNCFDVQKSFNLIFFFYFISVNIEIVGPDGKRNYKQQSAVKQEHSNKNNDKKKKKDNATDDFHYAKFRKQFRRH